MLFPFHEYGRGRNPNGVLLHLTTAHRYLRDYGTPWEPLTLREIFRYKTPLANF